MMGWRDKFKVHPAADVFPMMPDEELKVLGEDIAANTLLEAIVFWQPPRGEKLLIDGRNRLAAMELAGVSLTGLDTADHSGDDPVAFIISRNLRRRHLTKLQIAKIIVADLIRGQRWRGF
jgi:hypothetical protein